MFVDFSWILIINDQVVWVSRRLRTRLWFQLNSQCILAQDIDGYWKDLRKYQPNGPLVNAEYYPGWLTHWQEQQMARSPIEPVVTSLRFVVDLNQDVTSKIHSIQSFYTTEILMLMWYFQIHVELQGECQHLHVLRWNKLWIHCGIKWARPRKVYSRYHFLWLRCTFGWIRRSYTKIWSHPSSDFGVFPYATQTIT